MATLRVYGSDGAATLNSAAAASGSGVHNLLSNTWTASVNMEISRVRAYGDSWSTAKGGVKTASGTIGGGMSYNVAKSGPNIVGAATTGTLDTAFLLTAAAGCTYQVASPNTVIIGQAGVNHQFSGDVTVNFNWEANGPMTETWDETP